MYDYLDQAPRLQASSLHAPVIDRAANIPADARHLSPQPNPEAWMAPRTREITGTPQRPAHWSYLPRQQRGGQHDPGVESTPFAMPGETIRTDLARQAAATGWSATPNPNEKSTTRKPPTAMVPQSYPSPPLVHAADYPLQTPIHGDQQLAHTMQCADSGEHQHNFEESRHPPRTCIACAARAMVACRCTGGPS